MSTMVTDCTRPRTTSYLTSIASEISKGVLENDRIYPSYGNHCEFTICGLGSLSVSLTEDDSLRHADGRR